jgi:hypothetical protein
MTTCQSPRPANDAATQTVSQTLPLTDSSLVLAEVYGQPVITVRTDRSEPIRYGFEGGRAVKIGSTYHLFTSEMVDYPLWVNMKLGYWTSPDKIHWKRQATIRKSSGDFTGRDERAAYWSPLPVYDAKSDRWHLFYVAYKSEPSDGKSFRMNFDGRIVHAVSEKKGMEGIAGPYQDEGIVMKPGPESDDWEGLQGVDSFFPYLIGDIWYAFHGSANTESMPVKRWTAGIARSASLEGPWQRWREKSPIEFEKVFIENPVVTEVPGRGWLCIYDNNVDNAIGWAFSDNGTDWKRGKPLVLHDGSGWGKDIRTPMGLIDEGNNTYTVFYTAFESTPDWDAALTKADTPATCAIGWITVKLLP